MASYALYLGRGKRSKEEKFVGVYETMDAAIAEGNVLLDTVRSIGVRGAYVRIQGEASELTITETLVRAIDPERTPRKPRKSNGGQS